LVVQALKALTRTILKWLNTRDFEKSPVLRLISPAMTTDTKLDAGAYMIEPDQNDPSDPLQVHSINKS